MTIHFAVGPLEQFIEPRNYELRELVANPSPTRKPGWSRVAGDTPAGGDHAQSTAYSLTLASTPLPAQQMPLADEGGRLKRHPAQFHAGPRRSNASNPSKCALLILKFLYCDEPVKKSASAPVPPTVKKRSVHLGFWLLVSALSLLLIAVVMVFAANAHWPYRYRIITSQETPVVI